MFRPSGLSLILLFTALAGESVWACHHCKSGCKPSCCKTEVICVKACGPAPSEPARQQESGLVNVNSPVITSMPVMPMTMMPMMPMNFAQPVNYVQQRQPESAPVNGNCCRELEGRVGKVEDAVEKLGERLDQIEVILQNQTLLMQQLNGSLKPDTGSVPPLPQAPPAPTPNVPAESANLLRPLPFPRS